MYWNRYQISGHVQQLKLYVVTAQAVLRALKGYQAI